MPLKVLDMRESRRVNDLATSTSTLTRVLISKKDTLEAFDISGRNVITSMGWRSISTAFQSRMPALKSLCISICDACKDHAIIVILDGLQNMPSLVHFCLEIKEGEIPTVGWDLLYKCCVMLQV